MTEPLHFLRVPVSLTALARYADDRGWTRRKRRDGREAEASLDEGRALHHVLDETFGPGAVKPFRLMSPRRHNRGSLYAYTAHEKAALLRIAGETGPPEAGRIFALDDLDTREMPASWTAGRRLAFDLRVRPVVRIRSALPNPRQPDQPYQPGAELDAYLVEANRRHPGERPRLVDGADIPSGMEQAGRTREVVYRDWLAARFAGAAELDSVKTSLVAFERTRAARAGRSIEGPDATFHGELTITDPAAFAALLARGVGRHLSYGFGMLLLRPARQE